MATLANPVAPVVGAQIRAQGLNVDFDTRAGRVRVLQGIDVEIAKGSFTSIIGPSGCGKSTLLKVFAGLVPPTAGEVSVAGVRPAEAVRQRRVGMVFQEAALMPWKTALENVCSLMELVHARPKQEIQRRGREMLSLVGLEYAADRYPKQLSGGMRQRVSIARALALDPEVLMMDEPFGALDAITRETMSDFLLDIWRRTGKTIVFVTHSIDEAVYLSDSVYVMATNPARIVQRLEIGLPQPKNESTFSDPIFHQKSFELRQLLKAGHAQGHA
ncbi:ABC transporter ATP-binding protein [Bordetella avium]|uniref:ABC transporter ATP-binding protein n=1 Tax=Bordetella avium TaxID=521 RepID=UPI000E17B034|nr:ABC transporter ATP-binding protein [Bordetella avium]WQE35153.1 ABC transporter ATP-binding protein [Bordetella avium]SUV68825.1 ABC transporter ATP-binding protein [Bordetella avium]